MDFMKDLYSKSAAENEKNLRFWEDYYKNLDSLDFSVFSEKLTVPVLVPIGSRILFRGELKHTNEVTVALGADYFTKCSLVQAEVLKKHRMKDAQEKINMYKKEKAYLENHLTFSKQNVYDRTGEEIIEEYNEEEDRAWRKKHRENVKKYLIQNKSEHRKAQEEITDEELWNRLEELELQEEIENELQKVEGSNDSNTSQIESFVVKEEDILSAVPLEKKISNTVTEKTDETRKEDVKLKAPVQTPKLDLLQKVIDKQNELQEKLQELRDREKGRSKTESDLIARLDEMEQLDDLEDEMDRLDDIIESEDVDYEEESEIMPAQQIKRSVSFADEDDSETLEITFKHSDMLPSTELYDPAKGIQKPSDLYDAYPYLFTGEATSILKKTKYECDKIHQSYIENKSIDSMLEEVESKIEERNKTIFVKDVMERKAANQNMVDSSESRPTSLFKKKRMQSKS